MNKKMAVLSLLTLGVCSVAIATEYKSPEVGFKQHSAPLKEMKTADFGDHYKVEGPVNTDRQIASEVETDREPSSVVASEKKEKEMDKEHVDAPKPWLLKNTNH